MLQYFIIGGILAMAGTYDLFSQPKDENNPFINLGVGQPQVVAQPIAPTTPINGVPLAPAQAMPAGETPPPPSPANMPAGEVPNPLIGLGGGGAPVNPADAEIDLDGLISSMLVPGPESAVSYDLAALQGYLTEAEMKSYGLVNTDKPSPNMENLSLVSDEEVSSKLYVKEPSAIAIGRIETFKDFDKEKENLRLSEEEVLAPFSNKDKPLMAMIAGRESNLGKYRVHSMIRSGHAEHGGMRAVSSFGVMPMSAYEVSRRVKPDSDLAKKFPELISIQANGTSVAGGLDTAKLIALNPSLDAYLAKAILLEKKNYAKKIGIEDKDTQDLFSLVGYYAGQGAAKKLYNSGGVKALENHEYIQDLKADMKRFKFDEKYKGFDVPGVTRSLVK